MCCRWSKSQLNAKALSGSQIPLWFVLHPRVSELETSYRCTIFVDQSAFSLTRDTQVVVGGQVASAGPDNAFTYTSWGQNISIDCLEGVDELYQPYTFKVVSPFD